MLQMPEAIWSHYLGAVGGAIGDAGARQRHGPTGSAVHPAAARQTAARHHHRAQLVAGDGAVQDDERHRLLRGQVQGTMRVGD